MVAEPHCKTEVKRAKTYDKLGCGQARRLWQGGASAIEAQPQEGATAIGARPQEGVDAIGRDRNRAWTFRTIGSQKHPLLDVFDDWEYKWGCGLFLVPAL